MAVNGCTALVDELREVSSLLEAQRQLPDFDVGASQLAMSRSMLARIAVLDVNSVDAVRLTTAILNSGFAAPERTALAQAVATRAQAFLTTAQLVPHTKKTQVLTNIRAYLTASDWEQLQEPSSSSAVAVQVVGAAAGFSSSSSSLSASSSSCGSEGVGL